MERQKKIIKISVLGIVLNLVLVAFKAIIGLIVNSIAIVLDAVNNLSDALSSIITIIGIKLSSKAPDKEHPYGHGRIEYFSSIIIVVLVLLAGIISLKESFEKLLYPLNPEYSTTSLIIVSVAVIVKLIMGNYFKKIGNKINSQSLVAAGTDAFMDSILSFSTLIAAIISLIWHINLEGFLGIIISIVIIKSSIAMLKGTIDSIIGERADPELTKKLKDKICSFEEVQGAYDLILHNYGPSNIIGSVHIQVRNDMTAEEIHILTREITYTVYKEFGITLTTIGIYASNDSGEFGEIKKELENIVKNRSDVLQIHGFYVDKTKSNVFFDLILDFDVQDKEAIKNELILKLKDKYPNFNYNVILDSDISD